MTDISKFRAEIDAIDDEIIALLNQRSEIVREVGGIKKQSQKEGTCFIRSAREADLVYRIYDSFNGRTFPARAAIQIWRTIICASLTLESSLRVATYDANPENEVYWLTREYFGNFLPVSRKDTPENVIQDVARNICEVGVLPVTGKWWLHLPDYLKVFGCVPFILQNDDRQIKALAIARLKPEETGNDISLIKLVTESKVTQKDVESLFAQYTVNTRLIDSEGNVNLVEIEKFLDERSEIIANTEKETGFAITMLGAYAKPMRI